jgi:hypothetical protein
VNGEEGVVVVIGIWKSVFVCKKLICLLDFFYSFF